VRRLLVFTENYALGGGNRYLIDLINSISFKCKEIVVFANKRGIYDVDLSRLSCEVTLGSLFFITSSLVLNKFKHLNSKILTFCKFLFLLFDPIIFVFNVSSFLLVLTKLRPNKVLVCNGGYPASRACLAMVVSSKLLSIPVVMSVVSSPSQRRSFAFYYERLMDLLIWSCVSKIIVNANFIAVQLINSRSAPQAKLSVVYNGLDNIDELNISKQYQKELLIGCVARLDKEKGVFYLLDAFNILTPKYPFLKLVLVGSGNASDEIAAKIKSMGLADKVSLPGHYSGDVNLLLSDFDIYVFPSLWEGFPYSILEAMRSGCAIVSTNVGGIPEAITSDVDGILIEPGSSDSLVSALTKLIENPDLRFSMSINARMKFKEKFTLEKMTLAAREVL
jgi:glycosyltransferase involved in cell wall biosynthesis